MFDRVAAAVALAAEEHSGQVDGVGESYILHALHVLNAVVDDVVLNPYERQALLCAAVLHDVLEDTKSDQMALAQRIYDEFGDRCHRALDHLTRWPWEEYADYIERVDRDWIARRIKLADLRHNLDPGRAGGRSESLRGRYEAALARLQRSSET